MIQNLESLEQIRAEAVKQLDDALTAALENSPPEEGIKNYNH